MKIGAYSAFQKRKFKFVYLFIAFPVIQFLIFWVYVNSSSIVIAFKDGDGAFTSENFRMVLRALTSVQGYNLNINLFDAIKRSWTIWGLSFFVLFPIGVATTYVLCRRIYGHYVLRICYIIPELMGAVMWTQLICYLVQFDGPITELIRKLGISLPLGSERNGLFGSEETAFPTIIGIQILMGLVGNNAVLTGAFARIPDELYESADLDGAGFWTVFFKIAAPCIGSTISTLLVFSLCSFMTADYNVFLFTKGNGNNETATVGYLLYKITLNISQNAAGKPYYGYPAALGVALTLVSAPVVLIGKRIIEHKFEGTEI